MAEKSRSNQPRIGSQLQKNQTSDYHFAVEVSGQPAKTPQEKAYKKKAEAEARDYERRFPSLSERKNLAKPQGTQADHHVTDSKNHTKPASSMESAKRPAVGADVDAKKKYGSKSWNNGYTN